jgi:hypothetical protein
VGTSHIVVARVNDQKVEYRSELNAFVTLPFSRITELMLTRENVPHTVVDGELFVYGNEAEKMADIFRRETRRPMAYGTVNAAEPCSLVVLRALLGYMLGAVDGPGPLVRFSVPAGALENGRDVNYHEAAVAQILNGLGYRAQGLTEGLAVVYSELYATNCTGLGVSIGGGNSNVCLAYLSAPVFSFRIDKAGDYIDTRAAEATGEMPTRIRILKETGFRLDGASVDRIELALTVYYQELIESLVASLHAAIGNIGRLPKLDRAIPLVLSGGTAMPEGFRERFEKALRSVPFPIPISEVRLAREPLHATANGALLAALSEV